MDLSEQQQLTALTTGDRNAFEMLFRTYYKSLCNYAFTFIADKDEAEEVVQSTFLSFWEKRSTFQIQTAVRPYLYAMVRNACLNMLKHQKIRQKHATEALALADQSYESVTQTVHSTELEHRIHMAMEKLPEQCRLVFKLSRFEELKYSEIADELGISIKTVENQMGKALKIMRDQLKDYLPLIIIMMLNGGLG